MCRGEVKKTARLQGPARPAGFEAYVVREERSALREYGPVAVGGLMLVTVILIPLGIVLMIVAVLGSVVLGVIGALAEMRKAVVHIVKREVKMLKKAILHLNGLPLGIRIENAAIC